MTEPEEDRYGEKQCAKLEEEFDIVDHPKARALWNLAWEYGHSYGGEEVRSYYVDMVDLIK